MSNVSCSPHFQTTPVTRPNRPGATCRLQACGTKRRAPCWPCCCSASLCSSPYSPSPAPRAALGKPRAAVLRSARNTSAALLFSFPIFNWSFAVFKKSRLAVQRRNADRLFNQSTGGWSLGIGCWEERGRSLRFDLGPVIRERVKKRSVRFLAGFHIKINPSSLYTHTHTKTLAFRPSSAFPESIGGKVCNASRRRIFPKTLVSLNFSTTIRGTCLSRPHH